ncbi:hypothetical protein FRC17_006989 [Serendipita sp. 399]|nr:hypothetical protein FRC17_006989 [Serendipita sp. 399]
MYQQHGYGGNQQQQYGYGGYQQQAPQQQQQQQWVPIDQHNNILKNFRLAHEQVETQRRQMEEQEKIVASLKERISRLEGADEDAIARPTGSRGGSSVDDFSIRNAGANLERLINRWAVDTVRIPPATLNVVRDAALEDIFGSTPPADPSAPSPAVVQALLRHAMSDAISEGIINCLIVTNSSEANVQLTRIHGHLFARDPTVAAVWRRQTYSAAVESCTPEMSLVIMTDTIPRLTKLLAVDGKTPPPTCTQILDNAYAFSRMLHGSKSTSGGTTDAFYRAFVPELGSVLHPKQIELIKRCLKSERGETDRVGACVFPGLVKVSREPSATAANGGSAATEDVHTVVRRAQVMCQCALGYHNDQQQQGYQQGPPPGEPSDLAYQQY